MSHRAEVARRRTGVVIATALLVVTVVVFALPPGRDGTPSPSHAPSPSAARQPGGDLPPAWLAWIAGELPAGLAPDAQRELGPDVVVVAGDTMWLTRSHDATGGVVDHPPSPYRIPIDAFAVDPDDFAPFVPEDLREAVTEALRDGRAVLGSTSAGLRRIGTGGSLTFGGRTVEVGAVVPDEVVGASEMLVARDEGRALGIVHDRYLLALPRGPMTKARFAAIMADLIPGTDIRTVAPGGTPYARIASGVNPPVITKSIFGEFAAAPDPGDLASFTIDPAWVAANIVTREVPLLGTVTCHRVLFPPLIAALNEVQARGLAASIHIYSGCWAARTVQRSATAPPSQHAYGAAIDINAPQNPIGTEPTFDRRVVRIFEAHGFLWGGDFLYPDGHHFEWGLAEAPPSG